MAERRPRNIWRYAVIATPFVTAVTTLRAMPEAFNTAAPIVAYSLVLAALNAFVFALAFFGPLLVRQRRAGLLFVLAGASLGYMSAEGIPVDFNPFRAGAYLLAGLGWYGVARAVLPYVSKASAAPSEPEAAPHTKQG